MQHLEDPPLRASLADLGCRPNFEADFANRRIAKAMFS
jgi:hypothetical protein